MGLPVLIIEDEISIAELERDYLEVNGIEAEIEVSGDKGLEKALQKDYSLVILDVMLPGKNGFDICRELRSQRDTPILIVSAKTEDIDVIRGLGLGADDFIKKPFSPSELTARVKAHIGRYERLTNRQGKADFQGVNLKIDRNSRRVYVKGQEVILTTKEFDVLSCLAGNPNRVYSKEELFEQIWGLESHGDHATVTVHVGKIRDKICAVDPEGHYIKTVWGVGYRFEGC